MNWIAAAIIVVIVSAMLVMLYRLREENDGRTADSPTAGREPEPPERADRDL